MPKIECKIENWWVNSCLIVGDHWCQLYGDIYGHPAYSDGTFVAFSLLKADFVNLVAETEDAYVRLCEPQTIDRIMNREKK